MCEKCHKLIAESLEIEAESEVFATKEYQQGLRMAEMMTDSGVNRFILPVVPFARSISTEIAVADPNWYNFWRGFSHKMTVIIYEEASAQMVSDLEKMLADEHERGL